MLVRQLIRWQNTARKTSTYDAHESTCRPAATTNQPASAPANRSLSDARPGARTTTATTTTATATSTSSEWRSREEENSSSGSASTVSRS